MNRNLTGDYLVRIVRPAFQDAQKWLPRTRDRAELRRHALKLRFWPAKNPEDDDGRLFDLDWSWVKALHGKSVGELRIDDHIGNHDNLRIIFFNPKIDTEPKPYIWVLSALQKKRGDFSAAQISLFKGRRQLVLERFYMNP